jgi:predicted RNase H-like HicB family nuclease
MKLYIEISCNEGAYVAHCPSLPGCARGRGHTPGEALDEHTRAIWGYLAAATDFVPERILLDVDGQVMESHYSEITSAS